MERALTEAALLGLRQAHQQALQLGGSGGLRSALLGWGDADAGLGS